MDEIVEARIIEQPIQEPKSIYCHQCRQKRPNAVGKCVTKRRTRTCAVKYCPSCLKWYGEIAEVIASKNDWICYKCRGICSCSICVKREGKMPHGVLRREEHGCSSDAAPRTEPVPENKKKDQHEEVKLPQGIESIHVSGIDLPPENAGSVLQFLQFSSTFQEAIGLEAGEAESVVREILSGRTTRSQEHSRLTQMIVKLLNVILADGEEKTDGLSATDDSWFTVLGGCLAESEVRLDDFPPEMFQKGISEYVEMDSSQKLRLLNFLCDETLNTEVLRECMSNPESLVKEKEAKKKVNAAKAKEEQLWQKIKDELAKAQAVNDGVELTVQQQVAIVSLMDAESDQVCFEKQNASEMLKNLEYDDALRTKPVELDDNGGILWKLKSYKEEPNILLQDLGSRGDVCPHEKWFAFSPEQKPQVEKYISQKRKKEKKKGKTVLD